ncbi:MULTISPECIES: amino acid ABC transporter permease [unclassified Paenibacillus]|uniref:Amino acid ABC transporter permease n=1 Tax=Paenibacillus provencensis TaxID=441151 RepID=A0ABW3PYN6_9BACL|nr:MULTISPECIES: amino acid ABC transporter permease [unclassified Paenibacillus]MCM3129179.1 amino acid ABC transporter permease [Paenibacillus sp. MER 78]SFS69423.1 polar amino acid transport system permease protein [Paenibacillus sp. 453mf]
MDNFRFDIIVEYLPLILKGMLLTIGLSIVSIVLGAILGLFISFGKMAKPRYLNWPASLYINFFRGTPFYVQILIIHFGVVPMFYGSTDAITAGILSMTLNSAAYMAEIYRAGIQSVDQGQFEAAYSSGMNRYQTMRYIIMPQAIRRMIPAFGNEFIVLVKDSSLLAIISVQEIMFWSNAMRGQYYAIWEPYLTAALIYFILTYLLSKLLSYIECKLK